MPPPTPRANPSVLSGPPPPPPLEVPCSRGGNQHKNDGSRLGVFLSTCVLALCPASPVSVISNPRPALVTVLGHNAASSGVLPGCPCCSLSPHRTECTTGGAEAFWCRGAGLSLQPVWKTRTREELRDPFWAQVSAGLGPCLSPSAFPFLLLPGGLLLWKLPGRVVDHGVQEHHCEASRTQAAVAGNAQAVTRLGLLTWTLGEYLWGKQCRAEEGMWEIEMSRES